MTINYLFIPSMGVRCRGVYLHSFSSPIFFPFLSFQPRDFLNKIFHDSQNSAQKKLRATQPLDTLQKGVGRIFRRTIKRYTKRLARTLQRILHLSQYSRQNGITRQIAPPRWSRCAYFSKIMLNAQFSKMSHKPKPMEKLFTITHKCQLRNCPNSTLVCRINWPKEKLWKKWTVGSAFSDFPSLQESRYDSVTRKITRKQIIRRRLFVSTRPNSKSCIVQLQLPRFSFLFLFPQCGAFSPLSYFYTPLVVFSTNSYFHLRLPLKRSLVGKS